jgi:hypothetical protein
VKSKEEFAYLSVEILRQTVMDRDLNGSFKFPAIIRFCLLLAAAVCCMLLLSAACCCWLHVDHVFRSDNVSWMRIFKRRILDSSVFKISSLKLLFFCSLLISLV